MDIKTEDGKRVARGDVVYNYYDMVPCRIESEPDDAGWFYVRNLEGFGDRTGQYTLNGDRICTLDYAIQRGFKGSAEAKASIPKPVLIETYEDGVIVVYGPFDSDEEAWAYKDSCLEEAVNGDVPRYIDGEQELSTGQIVPTKMQNPDWIDVDYQDPGAHGMSYGVSTVHPPVKS